jgi:transposase
LLKLHTFGLLNNSFQPRDEIRVARTVWRHRSNLVAQASSAIQRMQKALTEMNVQIHNVLSDLSGVSGMAILKAIVRGERDPWSLAALANPAVKASPADIAKSLHGNWREELLLVLRQEMELYQTYQDKIAECDHQLRRHLQSLAPKVDLQAQPLGPRPKGKKSPEGMLRNLTCGPNCTGLPAWIGPKSTAWMSRSLRPLLPRSAWI